MKKQFSHEHHNRQDKAQKPEYADELREKPPTYPYSPDFDKLAAKHEARENEVQRMRGKCFILDGHKYKLGWKRDHFAKINGLPAGDSATNQAFNKIICAVQSDMKVIRAAIMNGRVFQHHIFIKGVGRMPLSAFGVEWEVAGLRCDEIK
jgi:hypothetical protein